eukprot:TRINITY_DN23084_c0_g1_i2.p1 TRINITY_DN23084_c0_g1~~TRINITY_DN23084_c0_g1_i2.p1  ORF type:complete len:346 (-),score=11.43 TRINITY_DN23084_c0_g1_i2:42-1079(-)
MRETYRVLELFSGIGGMHAATQIVQNHCDVNFEIVAAVDINTTANAIYRHNHPDTVHWQRNITGITSKEINNLRPDILLMSPPCQPHTRQGKRQDKQDPRSEALQHILNLIPQIQSLKYILLENVQGFESSEARSDFIRTLKDNGFQVCEFLINPTQIGIPNSRLRYYGLGRRSSQSLGLPENLQEDFSILKVSLVALQNSFIVGKLEKFLQKDVNEEYLLSDKILLKYNKILDIVTSGSERSCCFTKAYGQYFEGTGSVLQQCGDLDAAYARIQPLENEDNEILETLASLKLRLFTGLEIAKLLGFPASFDFPEESSRKQQYRTLGNSLNVNVVAILVHFLILS